MAMEHTDPFSLTVLALGSLSVFVGYLILAKYELLSHQLTGNIQQRMADSQQDHQKTMADSQQDHQKTMAELEYAHKERLRQMEIDQ
jgi:hypothetical protein